MLHSLAAAANICEEGAGNNSLRINDTNEKPLAQDSIHSGTHDMAEYSSQIFDESKHLPINKSID